MDRSNPKDGQDSNDSDDQGIDPIIGEAVGVQLKSLFDEFASEAVPDKFRDLIDQLERLEAAEAAAKGATPSDEGAS